ncbi:hypothetical protein C7M84_008623 [Penaeus vannamei]|uniref:Uncharacterized protein n=1 Tax=Penaeus vannamei TaxID=6689 RepID=A0A3R7M4V1_PENVA|nr:hypothetical protein C7M84_008623 [Penaeus vannamei]
MTSAFPIGGPALDVGFPTRGLSTSAFPTSWAALDVGLSTLVAVSTSAFPIRSAFPTRSRSRTSAFHSWPLSTSAFPTRRPALDVELSHSSPLHYVSLSIRRAFSRTSALSHVVAGFSTVGLFPLESAALRTSALPPSSPDSRNGRALPTRGPLPSRRRPYNNRISTVAFPRRRLSTLRPFPLSRRFSTSAFTLVAAPDVGLSQLSSRCSDVGLFPSVGLSTARPAPRVGLSQSSPALDVGLFPLSAALHRRLSHSFRRFLTVGLSPTRRRSTGMSAFPHSSAFPLVAALDVRPFHSSPLSTSGFPTSRPLWTSAFPTVPALDVGLPTRRRSLDVGLFSLVRRSRRVGLVHFVGLSTRRRSRTSRTFHTRLEPLSTSAFTTVAAPGRRPFHSSPLSMSAFPARSGFPHSSPPSRTSAFPLRGPLFDVGLPTRAALRRRPFPSSPIPFPTRPLSHSSPLSTSAFPLVAALDVAFPHSSRRFSTSAFPTRRRSRRRPFPLVAALTSSHIVATRPFPLVAALDVGPRFPTRRRSRRRPFPLVAALDVVSHSSRLDVGLSHVVAALAVFPTRRRSRRRPFPLVAALDVGFSSPLSTSAFPTLVGRSSTSAFSHSWPLSTSPFPRRLLAPLVPLSTSAFPLVPLSTSPSSSHVVPVAALDVGLSLRRSRRPAFPTRRRSRRRPSTPRFSTSPLRRRPFPLVAALDVRPFPLVAALDVAFPTRAASTSAFPLVPLSTSAFPTRRRSRRRPFPLVAALDVGLSPLSTRFPLVAALDVGLSHSSPALVNVVGLSHSSPLSTSAFPTRRRSRRRPFPLVAASHVGLSHSWPLLTSAFPTRRRSRRRLSRRARRRPFPLVAARRRPSHSSPLSTFGLSQSFALARRGPFPRGSRSSTRRRPFHSSPLDVGLSHSSPLSTSPFQLVAGLDVGLSLVAALWLAHSRSADVGLPLVAAPTSAFPTPFAALGPFHVAALDVGLSPLVAALDVGLSHSSPLSTSVFLTRRPLSDVGISQLVRPHPD